MNRIPRASCDPTSLAKIGDFNCRQVFHRKDLAAEWAEIQQELESFSNRNNPRDTLLEGGLNPGDRRAVYYLTRQFKPRSILEIGTHIGASTVSFAAAQRELHKEERAHDFQLTTVDIRDVNNPATKPWMDFGAEFSPAEIIEKMGCIKNVRFKVANSLDFLSQCEESYDFVFLDGDHSAPSVYQEVSAAMRIINPGGHLLLHDYFPNLMRLWYKGNFIPGPYLGVRRLQREGAEITVLPLGELPWDTKLGSSVTSLALMLKS